MAICFLKKLFKSLNLRDLICVSLALTKKMEIFLGSSESSGPSEPYVYGYLFFFFFKLFDSLDFRDLRDLLFISVDLSEKLDQFSGPLGLLGRNMYGYLFFFKNLF